MRCLTVDAEGQALVTLVINPLSHAAPRVGWAGKNGLLANFQCFGFEARPAVPKALCAVFSLRVIVAVAVATRRAHGLVAVQLAVGTAAAPPTSVGVHA